MDAKTRIFPAAVQRVSQDGKMLLDDLPDNAMKLSRLLQRVASNARVTVCSLP